MSELGSYITYEYAVLLQIFSYLPSKSLASAAQVCREWKEVARRVLMKRSRPVGYCKKSSIWEPFDDRLQPKVILHFSCSYGKKHLGADFYPMVSDIYNMDNVSVYNIRNNCFIGSVHAGNKLDIMPRLGKNAEAALILCDMPGVTVKSLYTSSKFSPSEVEKLVKDITALDDTKCLMIIAGGKEPCVYLSHLLVAMFNKCGPLLMAGGIAQKSVRSSPYDSNVSMDHSCLCISFHGRNVSAKVGLHELSEELEMFMENLAKQVGPLPNGATRFAFMFTCINRFHMMKDIETATFSKYFPNVPVYGLWSYGEFLAVLEEQGADTPHKTNPKWLHSECTSYLILTLNRTL